MIFDPQSYSLIFADRLYCLAIGFVTGFINQLLAVFLYKGRVAVFIRDVVVSVVFTVLIFSYSVSFANYRILRWYNVAFALVGLVMFAPCFATAGNFLLKTAVKRAGRTVATAIKTTAGQLNEHRQKKLEKKQKFTQKTASDLLKQDDVMLYN